MLFKSGSTYTAMKYDGTVISSGSVAETVIQAALNAKGTVYFADQDTSWILSGAFTGFLVPIETKIMTDGMLTGVQILVPNGFSGVVFKFDQPYGDGTGIRGLSIEEAGTPAKLWTGIKFEMAGTDDISCCVFQDIVIYHANIGIEIETTTSCFVESSHFKDIELFSCNIGILFDQQGGNIHRNTFTNVTVQQNSLSTGTYGFKDVDGTENVFISCMVWDPTTANVEMNIKSTAIRTLIVGGRLTGDTGTFINQSSSTLIIDQNRKHNGALNVLTRPDFSKHGSWYGSSDIGASGFFSGRIVAINVGTGSNAQGNDSGGGFYRTYSTGATINSLAGHRYDLQHMYRLQNVYFKAELHLNHNTNVRVFVGLVADASAPTSQADPLNAKAGIGLWFDSAVNANWRRYHNDASGAGVSDDTTVAALTATHYPVEIYGHGDTKFRFIFNGVSTDITTDIPASTTGLAYWVYMENTTGANRTMSVYYTTARVG